MTTGELAQVQKLGR